MNKIDEMKTLIAELNDACVAYYKYDSPTISDVVYDEKYDLLEQLEKETGTILAGSPTQKVQGFLLDGFKKVNHSKPMLSAAKTKDIDEIKKFLGNYAWYCSGKLDGLTLVCVYEGGKFVQGVTRGNGTIGEDVTDACKFIKNLPMQIPYKDRLELRGECVMSWDEFNRINENLTDKYSHPRNLAAGTIRQLDLNVIKRRELSFVVFECVTFISDSKWNELDWLDTIGFETVKRVFPTKNNNADSIANTMTKLVKEDKYPYDGLIFEIDNRKISESLGATGHHEQCRMALKWEDDLVETVLRDVIWDTSKTGAINPVAVFDEVNLGGAMTTRATLHNISYIKDLELGIGDTIQVYRANLVIPKVHDNLTRSNTLEIPTVCPVCGKPTRIVKQNDSAVLMCTNDACPGKLLGKFKHFVSKKGMDIDGLSEATLEKFIKLGWLEHFTDVYELPAHYKQMINLDGFGKQSVDKLMLALDKSRQNVSLPNFIAALSIPGVGEGQAKPLAKKFKTWYDFMDARHIRGSYKVVDGIGDVVDNNIRSWFAEDHNLADANTLASIVHFEEVMNEPEGDFPLLGKTFVITGKVTHYQNRDILKEEIESLGGKVSGSVSKNTDYLINNDVSSTSGKNKKAHDLNIPIISEEDYIKMIGKNN